MAKPGPEPRAGGIREDSMQQSVPLSALNPSKVGAANAQDPLQTDGDKYKTILENETVRVLEYMDKPGDKTHPHHHPDFVLYALAPFKRRLIFPDGNQIDRDFKRGEAVWIKDQIHVGENIGKTDTHVIIVEIKPGVTTDKQQFHHRRKT
jgi:beta-alanine degradation protein BauB